MSVGDCLVQYDGERLILANSCLRREFHWRGGLLHNLRLTDCRGSQTWEFADAPGSSLPGQAPATTDGKLDVREIAADAWQPARLEVDVTCRLGTLELRRRFRLYPGCPAIACDFYLRGRPETAWRAPGAGGGDLSAIESQWRHTQGWQDPAPVLERLCWQPGHRRVEAVRFYDVTDRRNNLVESHCLLPYRSPQYLRGNLLLIAELFADAGVFLLKEGPCSDVQLADPGADFRCRLEDTLVLGLGLEPADLSPTEWVRGYGVVLGVASGGRQGLLAALRSYQERRRVAQPGRDHMILLNTWGDRGQDKRLGEAFCLRELAAAARLGITHFQLDDGWQKGLSHNSGFTGGQAPDVGRRPDFWEVHPERFPNGLEPVLARARELGLELCLWYNPSDADAYANWEQDAATLIGLHRRYGVRTFKIDGVTIADKRCDQRLRAMLERVNQALGGNAVFNLDVTAGRRYGYHYFQEFGNLFLENRYTDWCNYYPHWTLRNLWQLAAYVPPQALQIEFLNHWRNAERYPAADPLAPARVPFAYGFAIAMAAQPLAWFEASGLPAEAFAAAPTIRAYREHQERLHAGHIFPIGEEPCGTAWTGFQAQLGPAAGYLLIYREYNQRAEAEMALRGLAGQVLHCRPVTGDGAAFTTRADAAGRVRFALPRPFGFALYQYGVQAAPAS